jgi:hypothetical protein
VTKVNSLRSGLGFFLTTLAGAFLGALGGRLSGLFGPAETIRTDTKILGLALLTAFVVLVAGMSLRRMNGTEIRSAMLGAGSVLISIPLSRVALTGESWTSASIGMATLGLVFFGVGLFVAFAFASRMSPGGPHED